MRWSGIPISLIFQFVVIHTVKGFSVASEAEIDVFLEFSCFSYDPADVGNLISCSSAFSKTSLNIWKFTVGIINLKQIVVQIIVDNLNKEISIKPILSDTVID